MAATPRAQSLARWLARFAGVARAAVLNSPGVDSHGDLPRMRGDRLLRDARHGIQSARTVFFRAGTSEAHSLSSFAWEARAAGIIISNITEDPDGPVAVVPVEKTDDADDVLYRVRHATIVLGGLFVSESEPHEFQPRTLDAESAAVLAPGGRIVHCDAAFANILEFTNTLAMPGRGAGAEIQLSGLPELRGRRRLKRMLQNDGKGAPASGVFTVESETGAPLPVEIRFQYFTNRGDSAAICTVRALANDEAARLVIGRVANSILPERGLAMRAERLLNEAADALDLRLLAVARYETDGGHKLQFAAGPAVAYSDEFIQIAGIRPAGAPGTLEYLPADAVDRIKFGEQPLQSAAALVLPDDNDEAQTVLYIVADTPRQLYSYETRAILAFAEFLNNDLTRRRASRDMEDRALELSEILDATRELTATRDSRELYIKTLERAFLLCPGAQGGAIFRSHAGAFRLEYFDLRIDTFPSGAVLDALQNSGLLHEVMITKKPVLACPTGRPAPRLAILVPLLDGDAAQGVLSVFVVDGQHTLTPVDRERLAHFAVSVSAAIRHCELFRELSLRSALVDAARDAMFILSGDGSIHFASEGAGALFGDESHNLQFQSLQNLFESSEKRTIESAILHAQMHGHWLGFVRAIRGGATAFDASVSISLAPHPSEFVAIVSDVTDRRRLEARALHAHAIDSLGRLAAGVAHDFNNLLAGIIGLTALLRNRVGADSPLLREIGGIEQVAGQAAEITRRLLILGRVAPGESRPVDMNLIITHLCELLKRSFEPSISILTRLDPHPCVVTGDETALRQAFFNLATNARDALPRTGGRIVFETEWIENPDGNLPSVVVTVSDNGSGMEPAVRDHLFEPFYTTKEPGRGTGLGTAIVLGAIGSHGGRIECNSSPGGGTTFRMTFPGTREAPEVTRVAEKRTREAPKMGSGRILLVEDDSMLRRVTAELLKTLGYEPIAVAGGEDALQLARSTPHGKRRAFDAVLLDLTMPGMAGPEVFEALRKLDPQMRIVITTGFASGGAAESLLRDGAVALLPKPYRAEELANALATAMEGLAPASDPITKTKLVTDYGLEAGEL